MCHRDRREWRGGKRSRGGEKMGSERIFSYLEFISRPQGRLWRVRIPDWSQNGGVLQCEPARLRAMTNAPDHHGSNSRPTTAAEIAEARIRRRVHALAEFFRNLTAYFIVIGGLWVIGWLTGGVRFETPIWMMWPIFPTLGWGLGLLCHGLSVFTGIFSLDGEWQERKVREYLAREDARRESER
jgi:hypothetical protein